MHGRVEGAQGRCATPGCGERGEYKAPVESGDFDGPGTYRLMCLDHVREYNARYNFFTGMSAEEISAAQMPYAGWERATRAFSTGGSDPPPAWRDFADPLDAIAGRLGRGGGRGMAGEASRFTRDERRALAVLGLAEDSGLHEVRQRYSKLVRRYHPDRNGGDRSHEGRLREVIEAWQILRKAAALA